VAYSAAGRASAAIAATLATTTAHMFMLTLWPTRYKTPIFSFHLPKKQAEYFVTETRPI